MAWRILASLLLCYFIGPVAQAVPQVLLPRTGLGPSDIAVVVNDADPLSRQIGTYYAEARGVPRDNVIHVSFPAGRSALPVDEFATLREQIMRLTPSHVQAYAVTWTQPYRVGCMGITTALAFGFDANFCSASCGATRPNPLFDSGSQLPWRDHGIRPAMMLAGGDIASVRRLIDRGIASDGAFPAGKAYLVSTNDPARNVRAAYFEHTASLFAGVQPVEILFQNALVNRTDVLFYFTGLPQVTELSSLKFPAGALADHLTSFGGQLTDSSQMSSLRWLEAGATASYGTVVEPCNHAQKFPFPSVAIAHYLSGSSAVEAYWKSVAWPGEGVFVGEPLARPFAPKVTELADGSFELVFMALRPGRLSMAHSDSPIGPFHTISRGLSYQRGKNVIRFSLPEHLNGYVRLAW